MRRRPVGRAAVAALALGACAAPGAGRPPSRPSGDEGMVAYGVGRLSFEVPERWDATGDARHVHAVAPDGSALVDVLQVEKPFPSEAECLASAEAALARGAGEFTSVRRHPTQFAGRRAVTQEADQGRWHGWAFAACDGGTQYRVFFTGVSPLSEEAVAAYQALVASAHLGAAP